MKTLWLYSLFILPLAGNLQASCWQTGENLDPVWFTASQTGAPIQGNFSAYKGTLCLPDGERSGSASVEIETASIDMGLPEFNAEMRGPLFFDSQRWPTASFAADQIEAQGGDAYRVTGTLTMRDISKPVTTVLTLTRQGEILQVSGEITLSRLAFDIGTGEWADTQWVGDQVTITLANTLIPAG